MFSPTNRYHRTASLLAVIGLFASQMVFVGSGTAHAVVSGVYELDGDVTDDVAAGDDAENIRSGSSSALATTVGSDPVNTGSDIMFNPGGGSSTAKDTGDLSDWRWQNKEPLDKLDLIDVLSSQYLEPTSGDPIVYIGATRYDGSGASTLGFWFLQDQIELDSDGTFDNPATGGAAAHVVGDVLIVADFGGSNLLDVYQWDGTTPVLTSSSTLSCLSATSTTPSCGVSNAGVISSPWPIEQKGYPTNQIGPNSFVEMGVNLEAALGSTLGCYQSIVATSRTSDSLTATLSDLAMAGVSTCSFSIEKSGPSVAAAGETVTYSFDVVNEGITPLVLDTITDDIIGDISTEATAAGCDRVRGGVTCTFTVDYTIPAGTPAGSLTNTVTAVYEPPNGRSSLTETDSHTVEVYRPAISVDKTAVAIVNPGAVVTYTFTITNDTEEGALSAPGITVTSLVDDVLGTIDVSSCGTIATGATCVLTVDATAAATPDPLVNNVTVEATHPGTGITVSGGDDHSLAINEPPTAVDDTGITDEDVAVTVVVLGNDTDPENNIDVATVEVITDGSIGSAVVNVDGTITYTPDPNLSGTDTITYRVCDALGLCDTADVEIEVRPINDPPVATDDSYATNEDTAVGGNVVTDDTGSGVDFDVDSGLRPSATLVDNVTNGTLVLNTDGSFTYAPDPNFNGTDTFTYTITDDPGAVSNTATVTINVADINDPPVATDNAYTTDEDVAATGNVVVDDTGAGVDSDIDGTLAPNATVVSGVTNGTLTLNPDGSFIYTPSLNYFGGDSFTYTVTDDDGATSNTATVSITINDVNDPPIATDNSYVTDQDVAISGNAVSDDTGAGVDSDVDGTLVPNATVSTGVSNGSLIFNSDGSFTYTPSGGFTGVDSFTYTVTDDDGGVSSPATVTIVVNAPPTATDNDYVTDEDTAVGGNVVTDDTGDGVDSDSDGTLVPNATLVADVTNGTLVLNADGSFTYTPDADFNGTDSFTYTVTDDDGAISNTATVTITVNDVNDPPVATDNDYTTDEDTAATGNVVTDDTGDGVDSDSDGTLVPNATLVADVTDGTLVLNPDGSFTYTPDPGFNGSDSFTYTVTDDDGATSNTATVTFTVNDVNDPPIATDNDYTTDEDTAVGGNVVTDDTGDGVDSDSDGTLVPNATLVADVSDGTLTLNADGSFTYTPDPDFNGTDSFTYTVTDDDGGVSNTATVTITVNDVNDPPVATDNGYTTNESAVVGGNVVTDDTGDGVDSDSDGTLTPAATLVAGVSDGTLVLNPDGSFTYTPDAGFSGTDSFTYTVTDDDGATSNTATVSIVVNDSPVATDNDYTTDEDTAVGGNVVTDDTGDGVDSDSDGTLAPNATLVSDVSDGTLTLNADGSFTYTPDPGFNGVDSFTYTVTDDGGAISNIATVTLNVTDVNDPPVATDNNYATDEGTAVGGNVVTDDTGDGVDSDSDGTLTPAATVVAGVSDGTLVLSSDGSFTYTPDAGFNGTDSFTYTVTDDDAAVSNTATVTIAVNAPPVATDNDYTTDEDTAVGGNVVTDDTGDGVDSDSDGTLVPNAIVSTGVSNGTLIFNSNGSFTYTPAPGFNGTDSFTYTVTDDDGAVSNVATVTLTVNDVNDPPVATDNDYTTNESTAVGGNVVTDDTGDGVDSDSDGTLLPNATLVSSVTDGTLTLSADGSFTYTPDAGFDGVDSFTYTVTDDDAAVSNTATVTIMVNDSPVATDNDYTTDEDTAVGGNVVTDDTGDGVDSDSDGTLVSERHRGGRRLGRHA